LVRDGDPRRRQVEQGVEHDVGLGRTPGVDRLLARPARAAMPSMVSAHTSFVATGEQVTGCDGQDLPGVVSAD
jgi:hypothetical protein